LSAQLRVGQRLYAQLQWAQLRAPRHTLLRTLEPISFPSAG